MKFWLQRIDPAQQRYYVMTEIVDAVALHHNVAINQQAARKRNSSLWGDTVIRHAEQFSLLPAYLDLQQIRKHWWMSADGS